MNGTSQRQLVIEIERVQTVRRRVATRRGHCRECRGAADLVELAELARLFEVSVDDAVLQLRRRRIHMQHLDVDSIVVCADSLLARTAPAQAMLSRGLPPSAPAGLRLTEQE